MTLKRFFQLFICYVLSVALSYTIVSRVFMIKNEVLIVILMCVIGYVILGIPLTVLTLLKNKK